MVLVTGGIGELNRQLWELDIVLATKNSVGSSLNCVQVGEIEHQLNLHPVLCEFLFPIGQAGFGHEHEIEPLG